ncbi:hypothetical protein H8356DRAFT_1276326 [Neocallimastix lanati (nom. inval.)]|jgi:hypothetical protein|nr:hypothetical protein H8356DRAFT_1276326 [Neocallimastix sp. JGI-2020a]
MGGLFERVTPLEFDQFLNPSDYEDINAKHIKNQKIMKNVYLVIFIIYLIIGIISLAIFVKLKNWYIIKQRNFKLTFINGLFAFISGLVTLLVQIYTLPCGFTLYVSDVINPFYNAIFLSRSLRIVLLYKFNIFKVTALNKKRKMKETTFMGSQEPNYYLPKIYKKVDRIIAAVIVAPTIIALIITVLTHRQYFDLCTFEFVQTTPAEQLKDPEMGKKMARLYGIAQIFGIVMAVAMIIMVFFVSRVKDSSKYGAKFECLSTIFLIVAITLINLLINQQVSNEVTANHSRIRGPLKGMSQATRVPLENVILSNQDKFSSITYPFGIFVSIYDYTKGGRVLFCIISMYMIFASIILPIMKCYNSKKEKNKYFHEPTSSIQYFYKVLNSPPLIEELRNIAIKEFSVENVLFWENYQVLQKMIYRYQIEFKRAERIGNPKLISQYDFEGYYQQQLQTFSVSSMDDYSYDPNMPVPREIMPYYISFYQTFIDSMGPASVNISGATVKHIYSEMCTYPTIGMFDIAKNEIVEMMYSSIFPILLRQNRKQLHNATINGIYN